MSRMILGHLALIAMSTPVYNVVGVVKNFFHVGRANL